MNSAQRVWRMPGEQLEARDGVGVGAVNRQDRGLPSWSSGYDSVFPLLGAQVPALVGELDPAC